MTAVLDRQMRCDGTLAPRAIRRQPRPAGRVWALVAVLAVAAIGCGAVRAAEPPTVAPEPPSSAAADEASYDRCMALARRDPAAARDFAQHWSGRGGAHPADHCFAVALIGLKQYRDGATRLETLAEAMVHAPPSLRAEVLDQAGQAWLLAGDPPRAYTDESSALALLPGDPDLLIDRAEAAGEAGWFDRAIPDLDAVLKANPRRVEALIYRATANRTLGRLDAAYADADAAVRLAPNSAEAVLERGNVLRLKGDLAGARRDWLHAVALAPKSAAALAAKANIARLAAKPGAPPPVAQKR